MLGLAALVVISVYTLVKVRSIRCGPRPSGADLATFLTIWPGVRTEPFARRVAADPTAHRLVLRGAVVAAAGVIGCVLVSMVAHRLPASVAGWMGIGALLLTFHFGLSDVVSGGLRSAGYRVRRLFHDPLLSRSLREFWSLRWNTAFVEMNQVVFVPWLRRRFGTASHPAAFLLSGLLHELAISLPVNSGYGKPTTYFSMHALATWMERPLRVRHWPGLLARLWTWAWVLVPLPLLFHTAFRTELVLPLFGGR
jgi:alginate O-acetyltransferase complex protein AlgI